MCARGSPHHDMTFPKISPHDYEQILFRFYIPNRLPFSSLAHLVCVLSSTSLTSSVQRAFIFLGGLFQHLLLHQPSMRRRGGMASFYALSYLRTCMLCFLIGGQTSLGTRDFAVTNTFGLRNCGFGETEGSRGPYSNCVLDFSAAGRIVRSFEARPRAAAGV